MPKVVGPTNAAIPIDINISGLSPHVMAYRLWWRDATSDWVLVGEGSTGDQQPDHFRRPFTAGAQLYYWIGVDGKRNSTWEGILTLGQDGKTLPNGIVKVGGQTDDSGVDVLEDWVNFV